MNNRLLCGAMLAMLVHVLPASAADDVALTRMALCQDSWVDWTKKDTKTFETFRAHFLGAFKRHDNDPYWLPKSNVSVLGMPVAQGFPDSVGMGVGFSLTVDVPFDNALGAIEKAAGKKLVHCENGDGMKTCALDIAPQRSITVMAEDNPKARQTLIGCYYFYEK